MTETERAPLVYVGPAKIDCPQSCDVPEGTTLTLVPTPRHRWGDVIVCPHEGCGCAFLVEEGR